MQNYKDKNPRIKYLYDKIRFINKKDEGNRLILLETKEVIDQVNYNFIQDILNETKIIREDKHIDLDTINKVD